MTDAYTDELFRCDGVTSVRYPVSRIVVDPERFENDVDEVMSTVGMGVVYTRTCDAGDIAGSLLSPTSRHADRCRRQEQCVSTAAASSWTATAFRPIRCRMLILWPVDRDDVFGRHN